MTHSLTDNDSTPGTGRPAAASSDSHRATRSPEQVEAWFAIHAPAIASAVLDAIEPYRLPSVSSVAMRKLVDGHLGVIVSATLLPPSIPLHVRGIGMNLADACAGSAAALTAMLRVLRATVLGAMPPEVATIAEEPFERVLTEIAWGYAVSGEEMEVAQRESARPQPPKHYDLDPTWVVAAADQSPFALAIYDVSRGRLIAGNAALAGMFGYTLEEFDAIPDAELLGPETPDADGDVFIQLAAGVVSHVRRMMAFRHKDGHMVWFEMLAWLIRDADGVPRQIAYTYTPQDDLIGVGEHWQHADDRFRHLSHLSPDPIFLVDEQGTIRYASPAIAQTLGIHAEDAVGMRFADFVLGEDQPGIPHLFTEGVRAQVRQRARLQRRDGEWRWFELSSVNMLDVPNLAGFTVQARDISDRVAMEAILSRQAMVDELTGLPNRRAAIEHITTALERDAQGGEIHRLCVMFLDLNGFKGINDRYGHAAGDAVLAEVGRRLLAEFDGYTFVARFGGDEFIACVERTTSHRATHLARRLIQRVAEPIEVDGVRHVVSAEVGLAMSGDSLRETPTLVRAADLALYAAKARRDGRPVTFARHMDPAASPVREAATGF
ncbi:MAG: diguanylate cyclase domain-containing protein [Thermomicrobiales bacterium]